MSSASIDSTPDTQESPEIRVNRSLTRFDIFTTNIDYRESSIILSNECLKRAVQGLIKRIRKIVVKTVCPSG